MDKLQLLKKYWGYSKFRSYQEQIIDSLLEGKDVMGILPTGGGKSLCYQLPALILEGSVLVISPLIALMMDQVRKLEKQGIKAMYFESHSKSQPIQEQIDNCIHGNYRLVYCSPERFLNPLFIQQLTQANFSLIAIDEVHCISEWGHDFRPSYRELGVLSTLFLKTPILALTASATSKVIIDIRNILKLKEAQVYQSSFERTNISYKVMNSEDKFNSVIQLLEKNKGSSIIYCHTRKLTENLAQFINQKGHKVTFFHSGLSVEEKKKNFLAWQSGEIPNITATSAFGMGIDKADVRTIIHIQSPESIENFYQETGRAGRDGKDALSCLLYKNNDLNELKNYFLDKIPTTADIKNIYKDLCNFFQIAYGEGKSSYYSLDLNNFCKTYNHKPYKIEQSLKFFELAGVYSLVSSKEKQLRVNMVSSLDYVTTYINKRNLTSQILEYLMRQSPNFFKERTIFSINKICKTFKISNDRLLNELEIMKRRRILEFSTHELNIDINPLTPREDNYTIKPVIELVKKIYSIKKKKIDKMIQYIQDDSSCKQNFILAYFGENKIEICKKCSSKSCFIFSKQKEELKEKVITLLKSNPHSILELSQKLYFDLRDLKFFLNNLLDQKSIKKGIGEKYYWINE